jgi:hypothetical protein
MILKRLIDLKNMRSDSLYVYKIIIKKISQKRLISVKLHVCDECNAHRRSEHY